MSRVVQGIQVRPPQPRPKLLKKPYDRKQLVLHLFEQLAILRDENIMEVNISLHHYSM